MEVIAISKSVRIAPRKVRLIADAVRKLSVEEALKSLEAISKRGSRPLFKTIKSAVANAKNNNKLNENDLKIKSIDVLEAPSYKRYHMSTRGRTHPYKRRGSHIRVILETNPNPKIEVKKEEKNGTKN